MAGKLSITLVLMALLLAAAGPALAEEDDDEGQEGRGARHEQDEGSGGGFHGRVKRWDEKENEGAGAERRRGGPRHAHGHFFRKARESCAKELGLSIPEGENWKASFDLADLKKLESCIVAERRGFDGEVRKCLEAAGIGPDGRHEPRELAGLGPEIRQCIEQAVDRRLSSLTGGADNSTGDGGGSAQTTTATSVATSTATSTGTGTATNPDATFQRILARTIQSKCLSCHSNFGSYSGLKGVVSAGNADGSTLMKKLNSGHPGQGVVSQAELQAIRDWINAGAPNN